MLSRRSLLAAAAATSLLPAWPAFSQEESVSPADLAEPGSLKDISLGKADAPVKVYEYASMTCTHCAAFSKNVFPTIKEKYIDTGKVLWTLREYPIDNLATAAFMLARCAGDDKYYAMVDVFFAQQDSWAFVDKAQVLPAMLQIARQAGFSQEKFDKCLSDTPLQQGINGVKERGATKFKVDGTPTFFINGKRFPGEMTLDEFTAAVDPLVK